MEKTSNHRLQLSGIQTQLELFAINRLLDVRGYREISVSFEFLSQRDIVIYKANKDGNIAKANYFTDKSTGLKPYTTYVNVKCEDAVDAIADWLDAEYEEPVKVIEITDFLKATIKEDAGEKIVMFSDDEKDILWLKKEDLEAVLEAWDND